MRHIVVTVALLAACRGDRAAPTRVARDDARAAPPTDAAAPATACPALPRSEPGDDAVLRLDRAIEAAARDPRTRVPLLLERAWIRGQLADYQRALADSERLVTEAPRSANAWQLRADALARTHQFAAAREALATLAALAGPGATEELALVLDHAVRGPEAVLAARAERARIAGDALAWTTYAATLAEAGRLDEALALIPTAATAIRNNTPAYFAWLLFQWGRIHELAGAQAAARDCFAEAHRRLPAHVESVEHLVDALATTGDAAAAATLAAEALRAVPAGSEPPPALRTLAYRHRGAGSAPDLRVAEEIAAAWERYVAALPLAFADHAARAYLALGLARGRALELANLSFDHRPTAQARELVIEVALAVPGQALAACKAAEPFRTAGTRRQRFLAWRALSACGRRADAEALASELGIGP